MALCVSQFAHAQDSASTPAVTPPAVTPPAVTPPAVTPPASSPTITTPAPTAASATSGAPLTARATAVAQTAINVLLVPLDEIGAKSELATPTITPAASTSAASTNNAAAPQTAPDVTGVIEGFSTSQNVGAAERAAAPLRRALIARGHSDVLSAAPESSVLRRAVAEGRLPARVISDLQNAMRQVAAISTVSDAAAPTSSTRSSVVSSDSAPVTSSDVAPVAPITTSTLRSASISEVSGARRKASEAAARIGRLLGYRAVVAFSVVNDEAGTRAVFLLVDSVRETGVVFVPTVNAARGRAFSLAAADMGSTLLQRQLQSWDAVSTADKTRLSQSVEMRARALLEAGEVMAAREELNAALALDPTRGDLYELLGDVLLKSGDANGSGAAYRRVLEGQAEGQRGPLWTKIAQAYAAANNWPETLNAGEKALSQKHDSLELRLAMAQAQIGRAQLFQAAERTEQAGFALEDAETHLKKALSFSSSDARVLRLQVQQMTMQNRTREALSALDRVASQFPNDGELQASYATALLSRVGREAEAFAAWSRAWNLLSKNGAAPNDATLLKLMPAPDRLRYRRLAEGFDLFVGSVAKSVHALTERVLDESISREDAILKARAPLAQILAAGETLKALQPPDDRLRASHLVRIEAADKLTEAVAAYNLFLENGEESYRDRAVESHKAAISQLNSLRQNL